MSDPFSLSPLEEFFEDMKRAREPKQEEEERKVRFRIEETTPWSTARRVDQVRKIHLQLNPTQSAVVRTYAILYGDKVYDSVNADDRSSIMKLLSEASCKMASMQEQNTEAWMRNMTPAVAESINAPKLELYDFQKRVYEWFLNDEGARTGLKGFVVDCPVGRGKTDTGLSAFRGAWENSGHTITCTVICPKSVVSNWKTSIATYGRRYRVDFPSHSVTVIPHVTFINMYIRGEINPNGMLLIDEAQEFRTLVNSKKNYLSTENLRAMKGLTENEVEEYMRTNGLDGFEKPPRSLTAIRAASEFQYVLPMSATFVMNKPIEMANQMSMVHGHRHPYPTKTWNQMMESGAVFKGAVLHVPEIVSDSYPKLKHNVVQMPMHGKHYAEYLSVEKENSKVYRNPRVFLSGMRQAVNKIDDSQSDSIQYVINYVIECIEQNEKVLICAEYVTNMIKVIHENLRNVLPDVGISVIIGSATAEERVEAINKFNCREGGNQVCIISSAGGTGVNFDRAGVKRVIVTTCTWNRSKTDQWTGRARRMGALNHLPVSERCITVTHLINTKPASNHKYEDIVRTNSAHFRSILGNSLSLWIAAEGSEDSGELAKAYRQRLIDSGISQELIDQYRYARLILELSSDDMPFSADQMVRQIADDKEIVIKDFKRVLKRFSIKY